MSSVLEFARPSSAPGILIPTGPSVVAFVVIELHDNGALSIQGNIGDARLARGMLDSARETIVRKIGKPTTLEPNGAGLVIPAVDVVAPHNAAIYPIIPEGDRP